MAVEHPTARARAKRALRGLVPPVVASVLRRRTADQLRFDCRPRSWSEALAQSDGYGSDLILQRVVAATRTVVAGKAAFERDSVLFDRDEPPFHILAALLRSAADDDGRLHVIDVGGSLGTMYRRCRPYLSILDDLRWDVVEQPAFADVGRAEFSTPELRFFDSLGTVPRSAVPATFLLSSVLQYVERPYALLDEITERPARHLVIDRTPLCDAPTDHVCIQTASSDVYDASYPCWVFSRGRLFDHLGASWTVVAEHTTPEGSFCSKDGVSFEFFGVTLEATT